MAKSVGWFMSWTKRLDGNESTSGIYIASDSPVYIGRARVAGSRSVLQDLIGSQLMKNRRLQTVLRTCYELRSPSRHGTLI